LVKQIKSDWIEILIRYKPFSTRAGLIYSAENNVEYLFFLLKWGGMATGRDLNFIFLKAVREQNLGIIKKMIKYQPHCINRAKKLAKNNSKILKYLNKIPVYI
jgi:hypothetical protein